MFNFLYAVFEDCYSKITLTVLISVSFDPRTRHTIWSTLIGGGFVWLSIYGINQAMVQRALTIKTLKRAKRLVKRKKFVTCLIVAFLERFGGLSPVLSY